MLTEKNPRQTNGFPALPAPTHRAVPWPAAPGDATARRGLPSPVARLRQPARTVVRRKTRDEIAQSFKDACSSLEPRVVPGLERKTSRQTAEKQRAKRRELCVCVCVSRRHTTEIIRLCIYVYANPREANKQWSILQAEKEDMHVHACTHTHTHAD